MPNLALNIIILDPLDDATTLPVSSRVWLDHIAGQMVEGTDDAINLRDIVAFDACDHVRINVLARIIFRHLLLYHGVSRHDKRNVLVVYQVVLDGFITGYFFVVHPLDAGVPRLPLFRLRNQVKNCLRARSIYETLDAEADLSIREGFAALRSTVRKDAADAGGFGILDFLDEVPLENVLVKDGVETVDQICFDFCSHEQ